MLEASDRGSLPLEARGATDARAQPIPLRPVEYLFIFGFWTLIALLSTVNALLDPFVRGPLPLPRSLPVSMAFMISYLWAVLTPVLFWLTGRYSIERRNWAQRMLLFLAAGLVLAIGVDLLTNFLRYLQLSAVRRNLGDVGPVTRVRHLWFVNEFLVYIGVLAAGFAREYFLRYRARREEAIALQAQAAQLRAQLSGARLAALRTQLNPHFLFNTLHAVSALVERDPRGVRRMIARLSELLRVSLEGEDEAEIALGRELAFVHRYLEIMQIRFEGRLEVAEHIAPGLESALVPNLVLQPLVENAFKHGIDRLDGAGRIEVRAERVGGRLVLSVRDNGPGLPDGAPAQEGLGLRNTRLRLAQLYDGDQSLALRAAPGGGTVAEVSLPYHTVSDLKAIAVPDEAVPT